MYTKQQWSVFRVEKYVDEKIFKHGRCRLKKIPAGFLERESKVRVFRERKLFDEGTVEEMGMHDGSLRFTKLDKVVPAKAKWYRNMPYSTGVTDPLLSAWFEEGDIVRIQVASAKLRSYIHVYPEYWR
jgi:hypothetical protein